MEKINRARHGEKVWSFHRKKDAKPKSFEERKYPHNFSPIIPNMEAEKKLDLFS